VSDQQLARLLDPAALDASAGGRARLAIEVPAAWLASPCVLEIVAPLRLPCARCDGGGCDGCQRSGCLRAPAAAAERAIAASLQGADTKGVALRLAWPFGAECTIEQLILEVRPGVGASPGVTRRLPPAALRQAARPPLPWLQIALVLVALTGLVVSILSR
jgi:hypothetical protein